MGRRRRSKTMYIKGRRVTAICVTDGSLKIRESALGKQCVVFVGIFITEQTLRKTLHFYGPLRALAARAVFCMLRECVVFWYIYYGANATENITLLRTLAGPGSTGVNGRFLLLVPLLRSKRSGEDGSGGERRWQGFHRQADRQTIWQIDTP